MSNPYINPSVKCAVRWYRRADQRTRHTIDCQEPTGEDLCPFALTFPSTQILPFQLIAGIEDEFGSSAPVTWLINDLNGTLVRNLSAFLFDLSVEQFANPNRDYIILDEPITHGSALPDGLYEMTIATAGGTYYSETFRVCADTETCFHKLTWRNCGDVGTQRYAFRDFTNIVYLPREKAHIGKPLPELKIEAQENKDGQDVPQFTRKTVRWNLDVQGLPWYLLDAMTEIPLHDTITLQLAGESGEDILEDVSIEPSWKEDVCMAEAVITFTADEASLVSGCCDAFDVVCPTPCVEADGVFGEHIPAVGEVFLLTPRGNYGTFYGIGDPDARDAFGFGNYQACPQRFATTTREGFETVFWNGTTWFPAVYILEISGGDCTGTITVTGNMMGQFGAQLQWSEDLVTWTDIGPVFTSDALGSGAELTDVPDEADYIRIKMVGAECVAAYSAPWASPCAEGPDLTFGEGGFNNNVFDIALQSDGQILAAGSYTQFGATVAGRFTRLSVNGNLDTGYNAALGAGLDATAITLAIDSTGRAVVGGSFTTLDGNTVTKIIRVLEDGTHDPTLATGIFNGNVFQLLIQSNGTILAIGDFTTINGSTKNRIVAFNANGTFNGAFDVGTGFNGYPDTMTIGPDGKVYVSIRIGSTYRGTTVRTGTVSVFRIATDGTYDSTLATGTQFGGIVSSIAVQSDGKVICVGDFTSYDGTSANRIIRLNADGTPDTAFVTAIGSGFNGSLNKVVLLSDGKMLVCCSTAATTYNGVATGGLVRLNADGTRDTTLDIGTGFNGNVYDVILSNGMLTVSGGFTTLDGLPRLRVARIVV